MIYFVSGTLLDKGETYVIVNVQGIGYQVYVPDTVLSTLPSVNSSIKLYTFHYIREDQQLLYGFYTKEDRSLFIKLTSVSGVGPKVGIKILSTLTSSQLIEALFTGNIPQLTQVPGIGKKVAERLVIELKDKLPHVDISLNEHATPSSAQPSIDASLHKDLTLALKTLGYHGDEIKKAFSKAKPMLTSNQTLEESLKILLKYL